MSRLLEDFCRHIAQTSPSPLALEIQSAEGIYLYDSNGKRYIDMISGISVSSTGHRHPQVISAIKDQLEKYLHLMVYGEYVQAPQVQLASQLAEFLPSSLNTTYFVNSGSEAVEGAMKLAKRFTGRHEIIAFKNAYHGSSNGALSVTGDENLKMRFRPLLPSVKHLEFNNISELEQISDQTACVIIEPVQGEAGIVPATHDFLKALRDHCNRAQSLLIFDEIQTGLGRTGHLFAFQKYGIVPDILLLAKAFGGGLPLGAFIASGEIMNCLSHNPVLGHISTFGGHPLSCAAALANLRVIISEKLVDHVEEKAGIFINGLKNLNLIKEIRNAGFMIALEFRDEETNQKVISKCLEKGLITDWFLFKANALRIAPPLTISKEEITTALEIIRDAILEIDLKR